MTDDIRLVLLGGPRDLDITGLEPTTSPITGQPLRRIDATMYGVPDDLHDPLRDQLNASRRGHPIEDSDGGRWIAEDFTSRNRNGGPWTFDVTFRQDEDVQVERLEFAGISLTPEKAKIRDHDDDGFVLEAMVTVTAAEHEVISNAMDATEKASLGTDGAYLPVRMVGVRDEPIRMRFGRCPWQLTEDGGARYVLVLVTEAGDNVMRRGGVSFGQPRLEALTRNSLVYSAKTDALIAELERAGILSGDAVQRIARAAAAEPTILQRMEYNRTKYLDDFWDEDE